MCAMDSQSITILSREPNVYVSTFFNEIVTCRLPDGSVRRLIAKRGGVHSYPTYGHRGGVPYEAKVYRSVLEPLGMSTPRFYAAHADPATGETTLLIDYVDAALPVSADRHALLAAARWIGTFHRLNEPRVDQLAGTITRYDADYFLGWVRRTLEFSGEANQPWLPVLGRAFEALADELLMVPVTVIHGEFYPKNILVHDDVITPVDWESAAIGAGEIDLASLTTDWSDDVRKACEADYERARWPEGGHAALERRLAIATMYLLFRWLGDSNEAVRKDSEFLCLRELGERLGVL